MTTPRLLIAAGLLTLGAVITRAVDLYRWHVHKEAIVQAQAETTSTGNGAIVTRR